MKNLLKIGTRGSPLALAQTQLFIAAVKAKHPALETQTVVIMTTGDQLQDRALSEAGGKGLFTKEIEEALLDGRIDCAVHSMKDMPTQLPEGLSIPCILPREDVRDAFFSRHPGGIDDLPAGALVGTSSLRRQAILLARRPDLKVTLFRGNVGTRLKKLEQGEVDATLLAVAGLNRLGMGHIIREYLPENIMLPAVAQGAIGVEVRSDDVATQALISAVHCKVTELRITAERSFLAMMDGSCRTPLAALLGVPDPQGRARFDVLVARPDGSDVKTASYMTQVLHMGDAVKIGEHAGHELRKILPHGYF